MEVTKRKYFLLSLFLSFLIASFVQFRAIFDDTAINAGVRNQIYWMARFMDPGLFPHDMIADHFAQPKVISPILSLIYGLLPKSIEPNEITQLIPLILVLLSTIFLFKASELRFNMRYTFWLCLGFNVSIWMIDNLAGGLQRAFFYPLFFFFLWMFAKRFWAGVFFCLVLEAFIYPISFIISLMVLFLSLIFQRILVDGRDSSSDKVQENFLDQKLLIVTLVGTIFGVLVIYVRYLFFTDTRISGYLQEELVLQSYLGYIAPLLAIIILTRFFYNLDLGIANNNSPWLSAFSPFWQKFLKRNLRAVLLILILFMSFSFWDDNLIKIHKGEYQIYGFLKNSPKDSLVAAPLEIADNIPVFSYRSILVNSEARDFSGRRYSLAVQERLKDLESIYSVTNEEALAQLVSKYGIDFLIIKLNETGHVANGNYILQNLIGSDRTVFQTAEYAIVKM